MHDGICDCCDGSDEDPRHDASHTKQANPCIDNCDEILKAERERLAKIKMDFLVGSKKRLDGITEFQKLRTTKIAEASEMEKKMAALRMEIEDIEKNQILGLKETYASSRMVAMRDLVTRGPMAAALLSGLQIEELETLIVHVCQIAGEIAKADKRDSGDKTCSALRVAAIDLGLTWSQEENYEAKTVETVFHNDTDSEIVQILWKNAAEDANDLPPLRWKTTSGSTNGRRRLDEFNDDSMMYDDDYPMHDDSYIDEIYHGGDVEDPKSNSNEKAELPQQNKFTDAIQVSPFSASRMSYLKKTEELCGEMGKILASSKSHDIKNKSEAEESNDTVREEKDDNTKGTIDSAFYTSFDNNFRKNRAIVETGFQWGGSAKFLLEASSFPSRRDVLERLLIGTLYYGQISAISVWQILQIILPEYKALSNEFQKDAETQCASQWAGSCPPRQLNRKRSEGGDPTTDNVDYPPQFILQAARDFCDEESSKIGQEDGIVCQATEIEGKIEDFVVSLSSLPSEDYSLILGYEVPTRRNVDTDPFKTMFEPISMLPIDIQGLQSLEDKRDTNETEQRNLQSSLNNLWKKIGGKAGNSLGRDGEYHSIADQCFEITANKYVYELCMFGTAKQKDGNSHTSLGRFDKYEYFENDGISTRVLKWTNGQKCWNGPKRSATVEMTCGPETKLISANEPDTCRYVFEMESHLACDEAYKMKMGL